MASEVHYKTAIYASKRGRGHVDKADMSKLHHPADVTAIRDGFRWIRCLKASVCWRKIDPI
jgi:hypothetical protein